MASSPPSTPPRSICWGYRAEDVVGTCTPAMIHDPAEVAERAAVVSRELGQTIAPEFRVFVARPDLLGVADENKWTYIRKDGSRITVLVSATAIRNPDGSIYGYLGIASDISESERAQSRIRVLQA